VFGYKFLKVKPTTFNVCITLYSPKNLISNIEDGGFDSIGNTAQVTIPGSETFTDIPTDVSRTSVTIGEVN
jgi:hypothetical protein